MQGPISVLVEEEAPGEALRDLAFDRSQLVTIDYCRCRLWAAPTAARAEHGMRLFGVPAPASRCARSPARALSATVA
ncbi:hypothetical protein [Streptomyces sp. NPDC012510]|uniref:hypothetical protein n=1 Tax=Streptomyces sp. NPDC012510 TaxID=3364838 RepID=UPI0036DFBC56